MEKTLFIHVWTWEAKDGQDAEEIICEQKPTSTIEDAVKQYWEQEMGFLTYSHTLHINYNPAEPLLNMTREMDINDFLPKMEV